MSFHPYNISKNKIYLFLQKDLTNKLLRLNQRARVPGKLVLGDLPFPIR
jgi:hypothetical protein